MIKRACFTALALVLSSAIAQAAVAEQQAQTSPQTAAPVAKPAPVADVVEPEATAALNRMGATLRSLQRFTVKSDATIEEVYPDGQKLMVPARTTYTINLPNQMKVEFDTDKGQRVLRYDGKVMTMADSKARKYVSFPLSGSVVEVFDGLEDNFGISLPVRELFLFGLETSDIEPPRAGRYIGDTTIGGDAVSHYAFRQSDSDWQIWLDKGDRPLPRKLVITATDEPSKPQFIAHFTWNTAPNIAADTFTTAAPKDYQLIDFGTAALTAEPSAKTKTKTKR
jgi:hypothetical protein